MNKSVGVQLDRLSMQVIMDNRKYVEALMEAVLYWSQQGIAFRTHDESHALSNPGNFKCLMKLISRHSSVVQNRLHDDSKIATWLSPTIQNEIIHFLADQVHLYIKQQFQETQYFTILANETKDSSKNEQMLIVFRYVHECKIIEHFTGYTHAIELDAPAHADYM